MVARLSRLFVIVCRDIIVILLGKLDLAHVKPERILFTSLSWKTGKLESVQDENEK
jgi:hypothetical protein